MSFSDILLKELLVHLSFRSETLNNTFRNQSAEVVCPKFVEAETTLTWLSVHVSPRTFSCARSFRSYKSNKKVQKPSSHEFKIPLDAVVPLIGQADNASLKQSFQTPPLHQQEVETLPKPMDITERLALDSVRNLGFCDLDESADLDLVKTQFRLFARKYHPDLATSKSPETQKQYAEIFQQHKPSFDILLAWAARQDQIDRVYE